MAYVLLLIYTVEPFPPPETIWVNLTNNQELTFSWSPVPLTCPTFNYHITSINCGLCIVSVTSTAATCTGFRPSSAGTLCSFGVQSIICGNLIGDMRTSLVNLKGDEIKDAFLIEYQYSFTHKHIGN